MARIHTDKRSRDVDPAPEAKRVFRAVFARARSDEVDLALALLEIADKRGHVFEERRSIQAWALPEGCGPAHTRRLLALARALKLAPSLAGKVRSGAVCSESAVQVGRLFDEPALDLDGAAKADWLERAESTHPDDFRTVVGKAIDDARQNAATLSFRVFVTRETIDGFQRVRRILSKGRRKLLTEGETLGHVVADWRRRFDPRVAPLPKRGRKRGKPGARRSRHRTAHEEARVTRRSGGLCECCRQARATQFMHIRPFEDGHGQTAEELAHGCFDCHFFHDRGVYVFAGWSADGRPTWTCNPDRLKPAEEADHPDNAAERGGPGAAGSDTDADRDPDPHGASEVRERAPPYVVVPRPVRSFAARRHAAPPRGHPA